MPRKSKTVESMLQLPASVKSDAKTIGGILNHWSHLAESTLDEIFAWGKKHKFLLIISTLIFVAVKFLLDEQKDKKEEEEANW